MKYDKLNVVHNRIEKLSIDQHLNGISGKIMRIRSFILLFVFSCSRFCLRKVGNLSIENQVFGEVISEGGQSLANAEFDGIFGMGFPSISATDKSSPLDRLYNAGHVKRRMFCFILHHGESLESELQIGGCEFQPTINIPLTSFGYWQFKMLGVSVDNGHSQLYSGCKDGCSAIMDTGTSLITGPSEDIRAINKLLGATRHGLSAQYKIECVTESEIQNYPHITFKMGDGTVTLTAADYILRIDVSAIR